MMAGFADSGLSRYIDDYGIPISALGVSEELGFTPEVFESVSSVCLVEGQRKAGGLV